MGMELYPLYRQKYSDRGLPPLIPDISGWFEGLFKEPLPSQGPMQRGQPQEPAGNGGGQLKTPGDVGAQIEAAVNRLLAGIFSPQHVRDGAIYGGAVLLVLVAVWAVLK